MVKNVRNKGITLIALIVTIVVLLILAGVTISQITGSENAMEKATEAREKNKQGAELDAINIAVIGAISEGNYNLDVDLGALKTGLADLVTETNLDELITGEGPWTVTGKTGAEYHITNDGNVTVFEVLKVESFADLKNKTDWSTTNNTKVIKGEGITQQQIVIPAGFEIASDSGTTLETGIVIKNATDGNEFVWVPVNQTVAFADSTTGSITLGRYTFGTKDSPSISEPDTVGKTEIDSYYTESAETFTVGSKTYQPSVARNIEAFKTTTNANKGYYIGRYEMGIEGATVNTETKQWSENSQGSRKVVCKKSTTSEPVQVYNYITRDEALSEAQGLYGEVRGKYTSDLVNSYAWDTALVYIIKCGGVSNYAWQNGQNDGGPFAPGEEGDEQCKINDMAKNIREWTTEYSRYSSGNYHCVFRGGTYKSEERCTASRGSNTTSGGGDNSGFRPILYIM
ncbi:MAG: hypothetical protein IJH76_04310 [Clostridia bacterium]|nr:hypothetical protein [Clostridia bacterium]